MYEQASERWSPVQSVEKVILSVISMLAGKYLKKIKLRYKTFVIGMADQVVIQEPNLESGANIDCCKLYRDNREEYEKIVRASIREQLGL